LLAVVSEDDQGNVLSLCQVEQFARAGNGTRPVGVHWTGLDEFEARQQFGIAIDQALT
jgi:hypothetical protein